MPSVDSNSFYSSSSSSSSSSSLSSPRVFLDNIIQQPSLLNSSLIQPPQQTQKLNPNLPQYQQQQQQQQTIQTPQRIPDYQAIPSFLQSSHRPMKTSNTSPSAITPSHVCLTRYKTELCRPFTETGKCKYGDKCQFSHGIKELRILIRHPKYKTEYCRTFHTTGYCPYGPRCHFIHDVHEARTALSNNDFISRRHSDLRTNSSLPKLATRNRINSDYTTSSSSSSSSQIKMNFNESKFPLSLEEFNEVLLSYNADDLFSQQYQLEKINLDDHLTPSRIATLTNSVTSRAFSSSSSNSSLAPQYV